MSQRMFVAALAILATALSSLPAEARPACHPSPLAKWMTPEVAEREVLQRGYDPLTISVRGSYYEILAWENGGKLRHVFVDPVSGKIIDGGGAGMRRLAVRGKVVCPALAQAPKRWLPAETIFRQAEALGLRPRSLTLAGAYYALTGVDQWGRLFRVFFNPVTGDVVSRRPYDLPGWKGKRFPLRSGETS